MNYREEWDFYLSNVDDKPGSFYSDMGLRAIAPVIRMPHFFYVSVTMNDPRALIGYTCTRLVRRQTEC